MYSSNEYADIVILYGECNQNARRTALQYADLYPNRRHPDHRTIIKVIQRLRDQGSYRTPMIDTGAPRHVRTPDTDDRILMIFNECPETSVREVSHRIGVSKSTIHRVMKGENFHPFHYTRVQQLLPGDYQRRLEFAQWFLEKSREAPDFSRRIIWTDECLFTREGVLNQRNLHVWTPVGENPHATRSGAFQNRWSINLWAGNY